MLAFKVHNTRKQVVIGLINLVIPAQSDKIVSALEYTAVPKR